MARENQGLQIALIVFVMLTIILGVTTYLFFRKYSEVEIRANSNYAEREKSDKLAKEKENEAGQLKGMIGVAAAEQADAVFADDMKKHAGGYPEEARAYHPLLEKMAGTIKDQAQSLALAKAQILELNDKLTAFEATKQPQIDEFKKASAAAGADLAEERAKFASERERITQDADKLQTDLASTRKEAEASKAKVDQKLQDAVAKNVKLSDVNKILSERQEELTAQKFDVPQGSIRWVNQRTGTVWIDLGRADSLPRQVTFSVYPAKTAELTADSKKASIEVTQILGDHLAEARILDDKLTDPIITGDKIHTSVWGPGEKRRFALAGLMDIDGDGISDLEMVKDIITLNGGLVDCYIDAKGNRVGEMTIRTNFLVLGTAPTETGQAAMIDAYSKMSSDASRLGVQKIQLQELLRRVGWKNETPVVHFGTGANPKQFAPKPDQNGQRKSPGSVSDVFKPRTAPSRIPAGAD
jgi:hypothetical protein